MFEGFDGWLRIKDENQTFAEPKALTVSEAIDQFNFTLDTEYSDMYIEGEVASFKVNQGKWVFFDLKEDDYNLSCFMPLGRLNIALSDGMKVKIRATPNITRWGKFSLTVQTILPLGEGSIKQSFELLRRKLTAEGLFSPAKKRPLPSELVNIGVISSTGAAGYLDFLKILNNRWGGYRISTVNTQVQGIAAAGQIIRALEFFNQQAKVDLIVILRGGGSADDLSAFNDEMLVRAIAASRIPVMTGIGHEIDESLADLAADLRASTPTHAAELISPDRASTRTHLQQLKTQLQRQLLLGIETISTETKDSLLDLRTRLLDKINEQQRALVATRKLLASLNPEQILRRGYAIVRHSANNASAQATSAAKSTFHESPTDTKPPFYTSAEAGSAINFSPGETLSITTSHQILTAEVTHAQNRIKN